jgi:hypothetical protein
LDGRCIVVCDYRPPSAQSITGVLRTRGYLVFQAHDGLAVEELCELVHAVGLLVLNTHGTGLDTAELVRKVRVLTPGLRVLDIGAGVTPGLPPDVITLSESVTPNQLLLTVAALLGEKVGFAPAISGRV